MRNFAEPSFANSTAANSTAAKSATPLAGARASANTVRQITALISAGIPAQQARQMAAENILQMPKNQLVQFELLWGLATRLGGPVALVLTRLSNVFDRQQRNLSEVELAFAAPQSTSRLVTGLPLVALGLAQLVGMNPLGAITGSILGFVSVCLGAGLLFVGHRWSKRLLSKALPSTGDPGAFSDCVLIGLQAGLPLQNAIDEATKDFAKAMGHEVSEQDQEALNEAAELSRKSGAALTEILLANSDRFRDELRFETSNRIARLGINLMIPLGVAVLPAFVLLAIVPIAISLLSSGQL